MNKDFLPLTVVMPSSGRKSLETTLRSITDCVDQICVVLNNHPVGRKSEVEEMYFASGVERFCEDFEILESAIPGLGRAYNLGINFARNNCTIIIDDDLIVMPKNFSRLYSTHSNFPDALIKGKVSYPRLKEWEDSLKNVLGDNFSPYKKKTLEKLFMGFQTYFTCGSRLRNTTNADAAYMPNVLVTKTILQKLMKTDGYGFNEELTSADPEFILRVDSLRTPTRWVDDAVVLHQPMDIISDLKSSWWYGDNKARRVLKELSKKSPLLPDEKDFRLRDIFPIPFEHLRNNELLLGLYQLAWQLQQYRGYHHFKKKKGVNIK